MNPTLNNYYNKLKIEKYLTIINFTTPDNNNSKFRMIKGAAMYGVKGQPSNELLTTIDYETNTLIAEPGVKNTFAKRLQTQIMLAAQSKGMTVDNQTGRRYRSVAGVDFK